MPISLPKPLKLCKKVSMKSISLLFLAFSFFANTVSAATLIDRLEASVNASIILTSDIQNFKRTEKLRAQLDPMYANTKVAGKGGPVSDKDIVDFLIDERLITQTFPAADAEVEQEINAIQSSNRIDRASLKSALAQQGFTFDDYFELIRSGISKRNLIDRDIRTKVSISDNDIKNYFYSHYLEGGKGIRSYKIRIIFIAASNYKTPAAAKETAQRALQAVKGGEAFEEVAKRMSDDASASSGGELGTLTEDQMSPAIRDQLKKLQIGGVSEVFGSPGTGYYIVKLEDVQSDQSARLEKVKDEIRSQLMAAEYQHQIRLWLERQRQNAFIHRAGDPSVTGLPSSP